MWQWFLAQIDISDELPKFSSFYLALCGVVMGTAFVGLYFHYSQADNHLLAFATVFTVMMSIYERYWMQATKSANLTLFSAVVYALLMV